MLGWKVKCLKLIVSVDGKTWVVTLGEGGLRAVEEEVNRDEIKETEAHALSHTGLQWKCCFLTLEHLNHHQGMLISEIAQIQYINTELHLLPFYSYHNFSFYCTELKQFP